MSTNSRRNTLCTSTMSLVFGYEALAFMVVSRRDGSAGMADVTPGVRGHQ